MKKSIKQIKYSVLISPRKTGLSERLIIIGELIQ